jgi:glucose/arabinose transport system permease protein
LELRYYISFILLTLIFTLLLYYGILWNLIVSFTNYSPLNPRIEIIGFKGFNDLILDEEFRGSLLRTLVWAAVLVILGNMLGITIASLIFQLESPRIRNLFTTVFMYPVALSMVVVAIAWRWLFDHVKGVNVILNQIGLPEVAWLQGGNAFWSLVLVSVWVYAGFIAMLYLAMFYNIDRTLIESAIVDGANALQIMTRIVIPNSKQGFIVSTVFLTLFAIQMFDLPYSMLFYNPFTETIVVYIHKKFVAQYFYIASAAAIVVIAISAFLVIPYAMLGIKRWVLRR